MKRHMIAIEDVVNYNRWNTIACSSGGGNANKYLDMNMRGFYKVTVNKREVYYGDDAAKAVNHYNNEH